MLDNPTATAARPLARARSLLMKAGLAPALAPHLLAAVAAAGKSLDDLAEADFATLGRKVADLVAAGATPDKMASELGKVLEEILGTPDTGADDPNAPPPDDVVAILDLVAMQGGTADDARDMIARGWRVPDVVAHYRAMRPSVTKFQPRGPGAGGRGGPSLAARMADGLAARIDPRHKPTIGAEFARASLGDLAMAAARAAGLRPRDVAEAVRMAGTHTTSDFPLATGGALENLIGRGIADMPCELKRAAHEVPADNYLPGKMLSLSASGIPQEIGEGGEIKHTTIDERGEARPQPRDLGAIFRLSQQAVINDRIGLLADIAKPMLMGAREAERRIMVEPLAANGGLGQTLADGHPVFHASHGNIATTPAALGEGTLSAARVALRSQRGPKGEHLNIAPWALVVPPQLETVAQKLIATITPAATDDVNPFTGLQLIVEVGLSSPTAWYLIGNPAQFDGLAYSYLDGRGAPSVEAKPGWEWLGWEYRLIWALDAKFVDHRAWYLNPGA